MSTPPRHRGAIVRAAATLFRRNGYAATGINEIADASKKSGKRLVGDVDFDAVKQVAGAITPVPGGVGPMTIAMLMQHTLTAAKRIVQGS